MLTGGVACSVPAAVLLQGNNLLCNTSVPAAAFEAATDDQPGRWELSTETWQWCRVPQASAAAAVLPLQSCESLSASCSCTLPHSMYTMT